MTIDGEGKPDGRMEDDLALPNLPAGCSSGCQPEGCQEVKGNQELPALVFWTQEKQCDRSGQPKDVREKPLAVEPVEHLCLIWSQKDPGGDGQRLSIPLNHHGHDLAGLDSVKQGLTHV